MRATHRGAAGHVETGYTFTFLFDSDGALDGLDSVSDGEVQMGHEQACHVFYALTEVEREKLLAEAWRDAEPEGDDWHAEDMRMPGAAE